MQKRAVIILICTLLMLNLPNRIAAQQAENNVLYFAPLPMSATKISIIKTQPIANYLSQKLQRPVVPKLYQSYDEIIQAFLAGEVHLLELGPRPFIELQSHTQDATPLASINQDANNSYYQCVLAAPMDGVQRLSDIKHPKTTKVALTQPLSTCGPLLTQYLLQQNKINLSNMPHQFLGSHEEVALALIRNEYAIGGVAKFIAERYHGLGLNILTTSPALPAFMVVANSQKLDPKELELIKQSLLSYQSNNTGIGKHGFSQVDTEAIEAFRAFAKQIDPSIQEAK